MAQAIDTQCYFHRLLRPVYTAPQRGANLEPEGSSYQPKLDQPKLLSLEAEAELPLCDPKDLNITVLEGQGSLTLHQGVITLEPGMLVCIPAFIPYVLRTSSDLVLMLDWCEPDLATNESVWVFNL